MIRKVSIRNFKSLRDVSVDLERFTIFVGPNASGKSSILQALNLLCRAFGTDRAADLTSEIRQMARWGATDFTDIAAMTVELWHRYRSPLTPIHATQGVGGGKWSGSGAGVAPSLTGYEWKRWQADPGQPVPLPRSVLLQLEASKLTDPELSAIVLIRDQDDEPERRAGLEQARGQDRSGIPIVIGLATTKRECWVISGFEPQNDAETECLKGVRQKLGFDPRHQSHELTAGKLDALRSPKRVLGELSRDDRDRECRCWRKTALTTLRERGAENGLADYLEEVR